MGVSTEDLRALVEGHEPASPRELAARDRFLSELGRLTAPCNEHADPTHVTASGIVVGRRGTVLHLHKRLGIWMQPGGHIDAGETPEVAARREATEELGLAVAHPAAGPRLVHLDVHEAALGHTHLDLRYLLLGGDDDPKPPAGESPDAALVQLGGGRRPGRSRAARRASFGPSRVRGPLVTDDLDHLLAVQDLDTSITQLEHRRDALFETSGLAAVEAELAGLGAQRAAATARAAALTTTQKELEDKIAGITERRTAIEQRMYAATSSSGRDLQAMNDEVRHLTERRSELEELELVAMLDQDPVDAELAALRERSLPLEARAEELRAQVAQDQLEIDAALAAAIASRAAEVSFLPTALADRYETLRARLRGTGAARLVGNRCDGCHLELSSAEVENIRSLPPDQIATCEQCGRILVPG